MSATLLRDRAADLARIRPKEALECAKRIGEPWFRAQALSWVARFTDGDPLPIFRQAAKAAAECDNDYKRSAVRAWEIAALAERRFTTEAGRVLKAALKLAQTVEPISSRSEALFLLFQAALKIDRAAAVAAATILEATCPPEHWRSRRARRDVGKILDGHFPQRSFFG